MHRYTSPTEWFSCHCCGVLQEVPLPQAGYKRICWRCYTPFGSGVIAIQAALAFAVSALFLFILAQSYPVLDINMHGFSHAAFIESGVSGLENDAYPLIALFVLAIAIAAPLWRIIAMILVLGNLHFNHRPAYLTPIFRISEQLRVWSMLDVLLLGTIVASSKLRDIAHLEIGVGFWALVFIVIILGVLEAAFDQQAIWNMLCAPPVFETKPEPHTWISCHLCELLQKNDTVDPFTPRQCNRCGITTYYRKPASLSQTWALVIAGFILYIPANIYPVLITVSLGQTRPSTIMQGVHQLMQSQNWALALILFTASIIVPLLKLIGLSWLMISIKYGSRKQLINRTRLYRCIHFIGRWSNTDIFVGAMLTGLVTLGSLATILPGSGALAFGAVVILTMLAVETFDSRLIWDAAGQNDE